MSLDTALAHVELEYLTDTVRDNASVVKDLDHVSTLQEDGIGGAFQKSLRVKGMIDELEVEAEKKPSWNMLAALIRSEYRLWRLNEQTPLRQNPFLSHWIEAIPRLEATSRQSHKLTTTENIAVQDIAATRLEVIKRMLLSDMQFIASSTPRDLFNARIPGTPFDVRPYIHILEEEGIYEPSPVPSTPVEFLPKVTHHDPPAADGPSDTSRKPSAAAENSISPDKQRLTFQGWKDSIMSNMSDNPSFVFAELTHLPIALPALEFLTDLLTKFTLTKHDIDDKEVILCFVQHALRLVEHMGQPATLNHQAPVQTDIGIAIDDEHGREAQSRALRLLILFLKNLNKKGFVVVDLDGKYTLYYDLEGMYRSYMWMKDVRQFKMLIEHGDTTDED